VPDLIRSMTVCVRACVCVCDCVHVRVREREKERGARERNATMQKERSKINWIVEDERRLRVLVHRGQPLRDN
jgi:hypothetical protein